MSGLKGAVVLDDAQKLWDRLQGGGRIVYDDTDDAEDAMVVAVRCPHCDEMFEIELDPQEISDEV